MTTADGDLVELLRQRVRRAREDPAVSLPRPWPRLIAERLGDLLDALDDPDDPAVLAVARALLGVDVAVTEWCVLLGETVAMECVDQVAAEREAALEWCRDRSRVASRTVLRGPWQVVDTDGPS